MKYSIVVLSSVAAVLSARVPGSPYPVPAAGLNRTSSALAFNLATSSLDDAYTVMTLQGVVSKRSPGIYRYGQNVDYSLWLNETVAVFGVAQQPAGNLSVLLRQYASQLKGYVLVDLNDNSTNIGVAAATAVDVVAVTTANEAAAVAAGLPLWMDVRGKDLAWALQTFNGTALTNGFTYSSAVTVMQLASEYCCMGDYSIAAGALQWWRDDASMHDPVAAGVWGSTGWMQGAQGGNRQPFIMLGWGPDEYHTVDAASVNGAAVVASNWAANLDFLSSFDLPAFSQRGTGKAPAPSKPVHTVAFMMTDGDNVQFLLDGFATEPNWFGSPDRGRVPMGWTLSPSLADLAPVVMNYLYREASDGSQPGLPGPDVFIAGVSGVGYFYPDSSPSPSSLTAVMNLTDGYMAKADMRYVNILTYADGAIPGALQAYTAQPHVDGVIVYHYDDYAGLRGAISFSNGKPVVGGRCSLWGNGAGSDRHSRTQASSACLYNVTQMVDLLLGLPADPTRADGYSLIPVHAWSHNVTDALAIMQQLEEKAPGKYQVVTPDVLMQRVAANVPRLPLSLHA